MEVADIMTDFGGEVTTSGITKLAVASVPLMKRVIPKIRRFIKFNDEFESELAIYLSMFLDFKKDGYTLEDINQKLCKLFDKYEFDEESTKVTYKETDFEIHRQYKYADNVYTPNEMLELESPIDERYEEILVPRVTGITFYLYPIDNKVDIEKQLMVGYCFLDEINSKIRVYHIINEGKFLYIITLTYSDKMKLKKILDKKYEEIRSYEGSIKYMSSRDTEIKIKLDKLISEKIGKILKN